MTTACVNSQAAAFTDQSKYILIVGFRVYLNTFVIPSWHASSTIQITTIATTHGCT